MGNDALRRQHPSARQRAFLKEFVLDLPGMIATVKAKTVSGAWCSCNIRGPFRLSLPPYVFPHHEETVLEPLWATREPSEQESNVHIHVPWEKVTAAKLTPTFQAVRENIHCDYQLTFVDHAGEEMLRFYIQNAAHPAVGGLPGSPDGFLFDQSS